MAGQSLYLPLLPSSVSETFVRFRFVLNCCQLTFLPQRVTIKPPPHPPQSHIKTHQDHENKGNDHQLKKLLIFKQILLVSTLEIYREQCGEYAY